MATALKYTAIIGLLVFFTITVKAQASCRGACGSFSMGRSCQCNNACTRFGDCCYDYAEICSGATGSAGRTIPITPITTSDISRLARDMWVADTHRVPGRQFTLNKQTRLRHLYRRRDRSPRWLFASITPSALYGPTITPFRALLNNYQRSTGVAEATSSIESQEIEAFLTAIFNTEVIRLTYNLLYRKGHFSTQADFRAFLRTTWFDFYSRSRGALDSSAFEHVFVGEVKNGAVTGFHNWLQFCLLERAGNLNYYGYTIASEPHQLLLQFNWAGQVKTLSSIMVGVSPEFELALFTVCFLAHPNDLCPFTLNGHHLAVRTWSIHGGKLGAAYFNVT